MDAALRGNVAHSPAFFTLNDLGGWSFEFQIWKMWLLTTISPSWRIASARALLQRTKRNEALANLLRLSLEARKQDEGLMCDDCDFD